MIPAQSPWPGRPRTWGDSRGAARIGKGLQRSHDGRALSEAGRPEQRKDSRAWPRSGAKRWAQMPFGPCHGEKSASRGRNAIDQPQTRRRLRSEGRRNLLRSADGRNLPGQVVNFGWTASHTSSQRAADWGLPPSCLLFTSLFVFSQKRSHEVADEPKASGEGLERLSTRVLPICLIGTLRQYSFTDCSLTGRWRTPHSPEGRSKIQDGTGIGASWPCAFAPVTSLPLSSWNQSCSPTRCRTSFSHALESVP